MSTVLSEVRLAFRQLAKTPAFSAVAVLTLALGIGATTALFSVVYGVLISPYPYARPHEIWAPGVRSATVQQRMRPYRLREFDAMRELPAFSSAMATAPGTALLTGEFSPETLSAIKVSGNAFEFLGVQPVLGRTIQPFDISPDGVPQPVAVLSFGAWQRLFGGTEDVQNRTLVLITITPGSSTKSRRTVSSFTFSRSATSATVKTVSGTEVMPTIGKIRRFDGRFVSLGDTVRRETPEGDRGLT